MIQAEKAAGDSDEADRDLNDKVFNRRDDELPPDRPSEAHMLRWSATRTGEAMGHAVGGLAESRCCRERHRRDGRPYRCGLVPVAGVARALSWSPAPERIIADRLKQRHEWGSQLLNAAGRMRFFVGLTAASSQDRPSTLQPQPRRPGHPDHTTPEMEVKGVPRSSGTSPDALPP